MAIGDESQRDFKNASLTQNNKEKKKVVWAGGDSSNCIIIMFEA